jgi:hypothetical protein
MAISQVKSDMLIYKSLLIPIWYYIILNSFFIHISIIQTIEANI